MQGQRHCASAGLTPEPIGETVRRSGAARSGRGGLNMPIPQILRRKPHLGAQSPAGKAVSAAGGQHLMQPFCDIFDGQFADGRNRATVVLDKMCVPRRQLRDLGQNRPKRFRRRINRRTTERNWANHTRHVIAGALAGRILGKIFEDHRPVLALEQGQRRAQHRRLKLRVIWRAKWATQRKRRPKRACSLARAGSGRRRRHCPWRTGGPSTKGSDANGSQGFGSKCCASRSGRSLSRTIGAASNELTGEANSADMRRLRRRELLN